MKHKTCKSGKPHTWVKVTRCVQGPVLTSKGFNYKLGKADKSVEATSIGGMRIGQCYTFRSLNHKSKYLLTQKGFSLRNALKKEGNLVFKVVHGLSGTKNTVSLRQHNKSIEAKIKRKGYNIPSLQETKSKKDASFFVIKGLAGKGISLMGSTRKTKSWFLVS